MANTPMVKLNDGFEIPALGLGTWKSTPGEVGQAVKDAIDAGYRHFDCAFIYQNEEEIGNALKEKMDDGTVKREDLFITSKLWNTFHSPELVATCLKQSLKSLQLEYLDLYLMHWPMGYKENGELFPKDANGKMEYSDVDYVDTWNSMEKCVAEGLTKSIGLSNFNSEQIKRILSEGSLKPAINQVECNPYLNQQKLMDFCRGHDIVLTAYSPLGSPDRPWAKPDDPRLIDDSRLIELAQKKSKTPAQIVLRWLTQRGAVTIPKSVRKERIIENISIFDFVLTEDEMEQMNAFNCNGRALHLEWIKDHKYFPFTIEY